MTLSGTTQPTNWIACDTIHRSSTGSIWKFDYVIRILDICLFKLDVIQAIEVCSILPANERAKGRKINNYKMLESHTIEPNTFISIMQSQQKHSIHFWEIILLKLMNWRIQDDAHGCVIMLSMLLFYVCFYDGFSCEYFIA